MWTHTGFMQAKQQFLIRERASQDKIKHKEAREITGPKKATRQESREAAHLGAIKIADKYGEKYDYKITAVY